jgi:hypothetical protein
VSGIRDGALNNKKEKYEKRNENENEKEGRKAVRKEKKGGKRGRIRKREKTVGQVGRLLQPRFFVFVCECRLKRCEVRFKAL